MTWKLKLIMILVRWIMGGVALGIGIWYLSSSIGGASLTYSSTSRFLEAIGVEGGDIATAKGCFLCGYVADMFSVIGRATEMFWDVLVQNLWIVMAIGFGIFIFIYTAQYLFDAMKATGKLDTAAKNLAIKGWFDKIWRQGARIIIVGVLMGALGMGGTTALKTVTNITITPVMFVGTHLAMGATGVSDAATCYPAALQGTSDDILNPVMQPLMCVMGNLNSVMLAGAAGGFALMNYSWLGLGGGAFTWVAGLGLVLLFLIIGFDLFFQVLSVLFKLIFLIIFLPIFLAAAAYEPVWSKAKGLTDKAIKMLVSSAVKVISITLKILIIYACVSFAADQFFPGPVDGYSSILPPLLGRDDANMDAQSLSVMRAFNDCEAVSLVDGELDSGIFADCFISARYEIEAQYPGAFDFMDDGWDFIMVMIGIFFLYYYIIAPKVDKLLSGTGSEEFDFGGWVKGLGKKAWSAPQEWVSGIVKKLGKS